MRVQNVTPPAWKRRSSVGVCRASSHAWVATSQGTGWSNPASSHAASQADSASARAERVRRSVSSVALKNRASRACPRTPHSAGVAGAAACWCQCVRASSTWARLPTTAASSPATSAYGDTASVGGTGVSPSRWPCSRRCRPNQAVFWGPQASSPRRLRWSALSPQRTPAPAIQCSRVGNWSSATPKRAATAGTANRSASSLWVARWRGRLSSQWVAAIRGLWSRASRSAMSNGMWRGS